MSKNGKPKEGQDDQPMYISFGMFGDNTGLKDIVEQAKEQAIKEQKELEE